MRRRFVLLAALAIVVGVCVGCDPGWVNPVLGTGDGSGSVPGGPPGIAAADVAAGTPWALVDLGARGYLVYDGETCTIMLVAQGHATRYAGNGNCGNDGDGGPATSAAIDVAATPPGAGLQADPDGNVYFVNWPDFSLRRIDATTGHISTVHTEQDGFVFGIGAEADGVITYLAERTVEVIDGDTVSSEDIMELRQVDSAGVDTVVASLPAASRASGFARVGPDHYVLPGSVDGGNVRIDVDHGIVTTTPVAIDDAMIFETAGADGDVYGITWNPDTGLDGNQVLRIRTDGTVDFIAGSGNADPGTARQTGSGQDLDLSAGALAMTQNGNLLIASGHVVYDLIDPADAPAIPPAS